MLTILLRHTVVNVRHRSTISLNYGQSILVRKFLCTSVQRQAHLPQLSPYDVNLILRENEFMYTFTEEQSCSVHGYESNQLGSNRPCEDTRTEASFIHKNAFICGIFDGHGGPACSQVVSKRLLRYVAASVIDRKILKEQIKQKCNSQSFLKCHNDKVDFVKEIKDLYEESFSKFVKKISSQGQNERSKEIQNAFLSLDKDLSEEALHHTNIRTMSVAMSGCVACVAHVEGIDLHVANTGDCTAVLGTQNTETGQWLSKKLTVEHNTDNHREVKRILSEHPKEERDTAIRNDRLLGQLAPLRALGDFRYKWSNTTMEKYVVPVYGEASIPQHYYTPPYLTAEPEVEHHKLTPNDKFLVIASDGLWDFLTPSQVVGLVGEHLSSKRILEPVKIPSGDVSLQSIADLLAQRKAGLTTKPLDQNSATHLIRYALGSTDYGIEHSKISYYLSLPQDVVRLYRDDMTIIVIYFNSDCISSLKDTGTS
uniref:PPM-type phosphatase domain-containing protein n=1 Tax=Glossina morsitans morsitans TaxID=37546 RepID=A0A240SWW7_GLOMM